jgi:hypothetical protein
MITKEHIRGLKEKLIKNRDSKDVREQLSAMLKLMV